jgi:SAM-dependent methyltransferase
MDDAHSLYAGSIPELYERYLVPLIFEPYARDLAARCVQRKPGTLLEIAAGTGVVTRELAARLPASAIIVATDLNQPMIDEGASVGTPRFVEWRRADAMQLPFEDRSFDVVACQFGVMFFPDKARAFSEARRVLKPGGVFMFNTWDRMEENDFIHAMTQALDAEFPDDPPQFMRRGPYSYTDPSVIAQDLARGGFDRRPEITALSSSSRAECPRHPAIGYCQGSPLRTELEAKGPGVLERATDVAAEAMARRFGNGAVEGRIQAHVAVVER